MQIYSKEIIGMSVKAYFSVKNKKIIANAVFWNNYPACWALNFDQFTRVKK